MINLPKEFTIETIDNQEFIKDPSGMLWELNPTTELMTYFKGLDFAASKNMKLPTKYDFFRLLGYFNNDDDFKKSLPMFADKYTWSQSVFPYSTYAYGLNGHNGYVDYYSRGYYHSVRCVR